MNASLATILADGIYIGGGVILVILIILVVLLLHAAERMSGVSNRDSHRASCRRLGQRLRRMATSPGSALDEG